MTAARCRKFAKRVEAWKARLGPLGLAHYVIDSVKITNAPGGHEHQGACVTPSTNYDRAVFEFRTDLVDWAYENEDFEYIDLLILHEWIHVSFVTFENAIAIAEGHMAPQAEEVWHEALDHAREQLVDRLARQLYAAFKDEVVPYIT